MTGRSFERSNATAVLRLMALSPLDADANGALEAAVQRPKKFRPWRELLTEGQEIVGPLLILSGWAARIHLLEDGRRQILNFLLPGDLIGLCDQERPVASSTVIAVTEVDACAAPDASASPSLARAYAKSRALEDAHLLRQITRLGRLNAHERLADLFLELFERMELAGLVTNGRFVMPLTQEIIADAVGLTSVHVNRTLQTLRRELNVEWKGRELALPNPKALRRPAGRHPVRVTTD